MNIREKNAEYDDLVGELYNKCDYCYKLILGKKYELLAPNNTGTKYFCSPKHKSMFLWELNRIYITNEDVKMEEFKYNRLKQEMTKKFELLQRRRGY